MTTETNGTAPALEPEPHTHCQICGRAIKASKGLIAHHGYERPGDGWQTASCFGARHKPYEVSVDRLPPAIALVQKQITIVEGLLAKWTNEPPSSIARTDRTREQRIYERPTGWAPHQYLDLSQYGYYWHIQQQSFERQIRLNKMQRAEMAERLAGWPGPTMTDLTLASERDAFFASEDFIAALGGEHDAAG